MQRPFQGAGAVGRVVAQVGEEVEDVLLHLKPQPTFVQKGAKPVELVEDDPVHVLALEPVEEDYVVDPNVAGGDGGGEEEEGREGRGGTQKGE